MKRTSMLIVLIGFSFVVGCATAYIQRSPTVDFSAIKKVVIINSTGNVGGKEFADAIAGKLLGAGLQVVDYSNTYDFIFQNVIKAAKEVISEEEKRKWELVYAGDRPYEDIRNRYLSLLKKYYDYLGVDAIVEAGFANVYTARVIDVRTGAIVATVQSGDLPLYPASGVSWDQEKRVAAEKLSELFK